MERIINLCAPKGNFQCVNRTELELLITRVIKAYDAGVLASQNASGPSNWDVQSSIFFAGTVVTTIGYGHIAPATIGGRVFCVFFALLGIPMLGVMLAGLGGKLNKWMRKTDDKLFICSVFTKRPKLTKYVRVALQTTIALLFLFFIPAVIFFVVESWTYGESLYYTFITLSTIGFGDFVPGTNADQSYRGWYRLCVTGWILIGLAMVAMGIGAAQELLQQHIATPLDNKVTHGSTKKDKDKTDGHEQTEPGEEVKEEADPEKA